MKLFMQMKAIERYCSVVPCFTPFCYLFNILHDKNENVDLFTILSLRVKGN